MSTVIRTSGLTKHYGRVHALDGLDLTVEQGQIHGFLGPNGAGKSTTIRILLGLARATGGQAAVFDKDPWNDSVELHRRIAYVPGDVSVWPNLSGGEAIDFLSRLRGTGKRDAAYRDERQRLMDAFQFDPRKKGRSYSKGNRQKVALIAAFAVPADLYILDEPTSGLDPLMEVMFRREIARVRDAGASVLLSSHILSEVEQLCDRVAILHKGNLVFTGTWQDEGLRWKFDIDDWVKAAPVFAKFGGTVEAEQLVRFETDCVAEVVVGLVSAGVRVNEVARHRLTLEDFYLNRIGL
jgi:ABC-2 type transport system ATP-binding protein